MVLAVTNSLLDCNTMWSGRSSSDVLEEYIASVVRVGGSSKQANTLLHSATSQKTHFGILAIKSFVLLTSIGWYICNSFSIQAPLVQVSLSRAKCNSMHCLDNG
jgi:hypothetical protein